MNDLDPHVDFRTRRLHDEADARRLAGSATRDGPRRAVPSDLRRVLATTVLALSVAVTTSGAYLAIGTEPAAAPAAATGAPAVMERGSSPSARPAAPGLPPSGGILLHQ
jgi:hypothetical protein